MVKRIINFIGKEIKGLHEAAYLLALFSFMSLLLGLVRDRLLASEFGASAILDVYYTSFRLPDLLFVIVTSLVSASVLVPIFSKHLDDRKELKRYIDSLFTIFIGLMILICLGVFIFVPQILRITAPGLIYGELSSQLILFTRILLLSPILLGVSQLFGGIVQAYRKFILYAISPILYNFGIILGIVFLYPIFGNVGLVLGVCVGLILHVLVQMPAITTFKLIPKITLSIDRKIIKQVFSLSLPRTFALASSQIILIVLIAIASKLETGSISVFNFAYNLQSVPMTIIGVSYSLAAFPTLSRFYNEGNLEKFMANIVVAARHIIFWSLPVITLFIVLRAQIVRTILGAGEFSWDDTRLTAAALALFIISALAQSLILLFVRGYYSAGQTKKPLMINTFSSIFVICLAFFLVNMYKSSEPMRTFFEDLLRVEGGLPSTILMLPLAFSIGMILNAVMLWISFEKSFDGFSKILFRPFWQSTVASLVTGLTSYIFLEALDNLFDLNTLIGVFSQGLIAGLIGIVVGIFVLFLIKNPEIKEVWITLHHRIWKAKAISTGIEEL
jgi:putative peptidoglycan lipid II flippase